MNMCPFAEPSLLGRLQKPPHKSESVSKETHREVSRVCMKETIVSTELTSPTEVLSIR